MHTTRAGYHARPSGEDRPTPSTRQPHQPAVQFQPSVDAFTSATSLVHALWCMTDVLVRSPRKWPRERSNAARIWDACTSSNCLAIVARCSLQQTSAAHGDKRSSTLEIPKSHVRRIVSEFEGLKNSEDRSELGLQVAFVRRQMRAMNHCAQRADAERGMKRGQRGRAREMKREHVQMCMEGGGGWMRVMRSRW
jgi:hypothetical protein